MHELSIARNLIEIASSEALKIGREVEAVHIKVGALSGVVSETLLHAYDFAAESTALKGSKLAIEEVPVQIYCDQCKKVSTLEGIQKFACLTCGKLSADLRAGRELEISYLEVKDS